MVLSCVVSRRTLVAEAAIIDTSSMNHPRIRSAYAPGTARVRLTQYVAALLEQTAARVSTAYVAGGSYSGCGLSVRRETR